MMKKSLQRTQTVTQMQRFMENRAFPSANTEVETEDVDEPPSTRSAASYAPQPHRPERSVFPVSKVLKISPSRLLRKHFNATPRQWNDWQWQLQNRIRTPEALSKIINLSDDEQRALASHSGKIPLSITPHYASLLDKTNPLHPLRRAVVPVPTELTLGAGESEDPLGEDADSPVPGIVHRYPDRVLFLVTDFCSTYCRYCTRSRMVGRSGAHQRSGESLDRAIDYIRSNPSVRDVLISGGDPLTLADEALEGILMRLRQIPHVEILRIGTKVPVVLPQRITLKLTKMLRNFHPLWINIHFMHPEEITPETAAACARLADAGIPLGSQTVLLKGINDSVEIMKNLVHGLVKIRVRPYYLYQCDPIQGSAHFRTPVEKGLEIIRGLRGHTTGLAIPTYVIDAPGGGGKVPLTPAYVAGREGSDIVLTNYENRTFRYPDNQQIGSQQGDQR